MTEKTTLGKPARKRTSKAKAVPPPINGHEAAAPPTRPTDIRAAHAERVRTQPPVEGPTHRRGEGVKDPRDPLADVPQYLPGQLPKVWENYMADCCASWGGDPGTYATPFLSVVCGVLHSTVKMNTNPLKPEVLRNPNDHALVFGKSGDNKSGLLRDLMRRQEKWHADAAKKRSPLTGKRGKDMGPRVMLQRASVEGAFAQITDNQGERLILTTEEAMGFLKGAGAHRGEGATDAVNDLLTSGYDGGVYSKRLVTKQLDIPECLATFTGVGIFGEMVDWDGFPLAITSGAMARTTVGLMAHVALRETTKRVEGAEAAMFSTLDKLHALRHVHFRLSSEATGRWFKFTATKEASIRTMQEDGETEGLIAWAKKYDMRVMAMATAFQAIEFIESGGVACVETQIKGEEPVQGVEGRVEEPKVLRTVTISEENLVRAAKVVEGYLFDVQRVFYERAAGMVEFHRELVNFMAYRISMRYTDRHDAVVSRDDLTYNGPKRLRGPVTDARKDLHRRWITALLDHGFIEPHDKPGARQFKKPRADNELAWYRLRDEFFEYFNSAGDRAWAQQQYAQSRVGDAAVVARGAARGVEI